MRTTVGAVADHWESLRLAISATWDAACKRCWRCGRGARLHRCHIVPASLGGADAPDNLLLMCAQCHQAAPNCDDPMIMAQWFERTRTTDFYDWYDAQWAHAYVMMFDRQPLAGLPAGRDTPGFELALRNAVRRTISHHGHGWLNDATFAGAVYLAEQQILGPDPAGWPV